MIVILYLMFGLLEAGLSVWSCWEFRKEVNLRTKVLAFIIKVLFWPILYFII